MSITENAMRNRENAAKAAELDRQGAMRREANIANKGMQVGKRLATREAYEQAQNLLSALDRPEMRGPDAAGGSPYVVDPTREEAVDYMKRNYRDGYDNLMYGQTDDMNARQAQVGREMYQGDIGQTRRQIADSFPAVVQQDPTSGYKVLEHYVSQNVLSPEEAFMLGKENGLYAEPEQGDAPALAKF